MTDNVDDFLKHYGVKGMRWGVSKAANGISSGVRKAVQKNKKKREAVKADREATSESAKAAGYHPRMRKLDLDDIGKRGVRRVEKRIANGEGITSARIKEHAGKTARGMAAGAAIIATPFMLNSMSRGLSTLAKNIDAKRGAEVARNLLADSRGLTSYQTVALSFNAAKGIWE